MSDEKKYNGIEIVVRSPFPQEFTLKQAWAMIEIVQEDMVKYMKEKGSILVSIEPYKNQK